MKLQTGMMPSIDQIASQYLNNRNTASSANTVSDSSFESILANKQLHTENSDGLKFSKHASCRLSDRQIDLSSEQLQRLNEGAVKAEAKGIKEPLVMVDNLAFIVNIKNNTVVTAMDSTKADESVYTNIDGAVIA